MKKLGITEEEGLSADDQFLHYFSLFRAPLTDEAIKVMMALCGLDDVATAGAV